MLSSFTTVETLDTRAAWPKASVSKARGVDRTARKTPPAGATTMTPTRLWASLNRSISFRITPFCPPPLPSQSSDSRVARVRPKKVEERTPKGGSSFARGSEGSRAKGRVTPRQAHHGPPTYGTCICTVLCNYWSSLFQNFATCWTPITGTEARQRLKLPILVEFPSR